MMKPREKDGWPVEKITGRPITNFFRVLLYTNIIQTIRLRNRGPEDKVPVGGIR